jgi:hypothetical protein
MLPGVPKEFIVTVKDSRCRTMVQTVCRIYIVLPEKKISHLKSDMRFMLQTYIAVKLLALLLCILDVLESNICPGYASVFCDFISPSRQMLG